MKKIERTKTGLLVWRAYRDYRHMCIVTRQGAVRTNIHANAPVSETAVFNINRVESDLEHCACFCKLQTLIAMNYPHVIPIEELWKYHFLAEIHEEGEILNGDVPADGTRDDVALDRLEGNEIYSHLGANYPEEYRKLGWSLYQEFEKKDTPRGQVNYLGDKTDSFLMALYYESIGKFGDVMHKVRAYGAKETECVDIQSMKYTKTVSPVDNWLCAVLREPGALKYAHLDVFLEILQSAVFAVRKKEMLWLNDFLETWSKNYQ